MNKVKIQNTGITDPEKIIEILIEEGFDRPFRWNDAPETFYSWHIHRDMEVRWIYDGEMIIGTDEGEFVLKAGDRIDIPANTRHWAKTEKGVHYIAASKI